MGTTIDTLLQRLEEPPLHLDLADSAALGRVRALADELLQSGRSLPELDALEAELLVDRDAVALAGHLAVRLARSRRMLEALQGPLRVDVVFAMYKEHHRIGSASEHPNGEDFLRRKLDQLAWLFADRDDVDWQLWPIDDGCPEHSGDLAHAIAREHPDGDRVNVRFLADAIANGHPAADGLSTPADSQKGGSILYGMAEAAGAPAADAARHVVIFTDADLSTHLGQVGLLLHPILADGATAAIGSRRQPASVVVKKGARNTRGKLFIYLWKRLIDALPSIIDSQCGFKAFDAALVRQIVAPAVEKRFAFDLELLTKTAVRGGRIEQVAVAWIDSEAESTTTDLQPYLPMLQALTRVYRTYLPPRDAAEPFANFIESLDEASWQRLLENIPKEIAEADPATFESFAGVDADTLRAHAH
jgi:hypothetical protein